MSDTHRLVRESAPYKRREVHSVYHLHHLGVVEVVDDVLQDVSVGHEPQRSEHDDDGHFLPNVWQCGHDPLPNGALLYSLKAGRGGGGGNVPVRIERFLRLKPNIDSQKRPLGKSQ